MRQTEHERKALDGARAELPPTYGVLLVSVATAWTLISCAVLGFGGLVGPGRPRLIPLMVVAQMMAVIAMIVTSRKSKLRRMYWGASLIGSGLGVGQYWLLVGTVALFAI